MVNHFSKHLNLVLRHSLILTLEEEKEEEEATVEMVKMVDQVRMEWMLLATQMELMEAQVEMEETVEMARVEQTEEKVDTFR